jgi:hypothetical protein
LRLPLSLLGAHEKAAPDSSLQSDPTSDLNSLPKGPQ